MSGVNLKSGEYADNLKIIERFFLKTPKSGFLFAVCNDELVQQEINASIRFLLQGKGKTIRIHAWEKKDDAAPPLEQLRALTRKYPDTAGIILTALDGALYHNPNLLVQLNFGREALSELAIPLLFWLTSRSLQKISVEAIDLYNQRASANLYFEHALETTDTAHSALHYVALETVHSNNNLGHIEARLKLLQQQLEEAEKNQRDPVDIANEIVLELLKIYAQIHGTARLMRSLIEQYYDQFDLEKPETCMTVAYALIFSGAYEKARFLTERALSMYRELAITNPQTYLPHVADTLTRLADLLHDRNEFTKAEQGYREALEIQRELVLANPQSDLYLSDIAATLNNLAKLQMYQSDFTSAEQGYREALEIRRKLAEINPQTYLPYVAKTLYNLAVLQSEKNDFEGAEAGYKEALAIQEKVLGSDHPETLRTRDNLDKLSERMQKSASSLGRL
jgi:tetratricopeptide (TPR) repeat protein